MALSRVEYAALIAEATRRSVGVVLNDCQLAIAIAMMDQLEGRRWRRSRRSIKVLRNLLPGEQDWVLAAAIPTFRYALPGHKVDVMAINDTTVALASDLYGKIAAELNAPDASITYGRYDPMQAGDVAILLGSSARHRNYQRVACLPWW